MVVSAKGGGGVSTVQEFSNLDISQYRTEAALVAKRLE